jgi:hypothetical protein
LRTSKAVLHSRAIARTAIILIVVASNAEGRLLLRTALNDHPERRLSHRGVGRIRAGARGSSGGSRRAIAAEPHVRPVIATQKRPPYSRSILLAPLDRRWEEAAARRDARWYDDGRTRMRLWSNRSMAPKEFCTRQSGFELIWSRLTGGGMGQTRRLLMGSVSRSFVRRAKT